MDEDLDSKGRRVCHDMVLQCSPWMATTAGTCPDDRLCALHLITFGCVVSSTLSLGSPSHRSRCSTRRFTVQAESSTVCASCLTSRVHGAARSSRPFS